MRLRQRYLVRSLITVAALSAAPARAQDPNRELQRSLKDTDVDASWIYNDLDAGFAAARRTGKPLLVVFR